MNILNLFGACIFYMLLLLSRNMEIDPDVFNPFLVITSTFCVEDLHKEPNKGYFQNVFSKVVSSSSDGLNFTVKNGFPIRSISSLKCLRDMKVVILTQDNQIIQYDTNSQTFEMFGPSEIVKSISLVETSQSSHQIVYITQKHVHVLGSILSLSPIAYDLPLHTSISKIDCSKRRNTTFDGYCFMSSLHNAKIFYFHYSSPHKILQRSLLDHSSFYISEMKERMYVGFNDGQINQYSLKEGLLFYERSTSISSGKGIIHLTANQFRDELLYYNNQSKLGLFNLTSGSEVASLQISQIYCQNSTRLTFLSKTVFALHGDGQGINLYNSSKITVSNPVSANLLFLKKHCPNQNHYFNSSNSNCLACQNGCKLCDQQTAICFQCENQYFFRQNKCFSCKYASITSQYYGDCFQENQTQIMLISKALTPYLTASIQYTYSILSGSALIFLFLRFINFWSIVSIYYFLNISHVPTFLLQLLQKIFTVLHGSVFEIFDIDIAQIKMGVQERQISQKMLNAKITTDFLASNFQSILTFLYSLVLICILYDSIKTWFQKFRIQIFEQVRLEACLEEFIGIFIPLLVPLSYFLINLTCSNFLNKLNNALFMLFFGIGMVFPFFYMILITKRVTLEQRLAMIKKEIRQNKPQSKEDINHIQTSTKMQTGKKRFYQIQIISQQQGQKFLYCLNSFWVSFLVGLEEPGLFLFVIFVINILCVWNATYSNNFRANLILKKTILLLYHICFILIYLIPEIYLKMATIASILIIIGGIHELISAIGQKIYFVYLTCQQRKIRPNNKVQDDCSGGKSNCNQILQVQRSKDKDPELSQESKQHFQRSLNNTQAKTQTQVKSKQLNKKKIIKGNHPIFKNSFNTKTNKSIKLQRKPKFLNMIQTKNQIQVNSSKSQYQQKSNSKVKFQQILNQKTLGPSENYTQSIQFEKRSLFDCQFIQVQKQNSYNNQIDIPKKTKFGFKFEKKTKHIQYLGPHQLTAKFERHGTQNQVQFFPKEDLDKDFPSNKRANQKKVQSQIDLTIQTNKPYSSKETASPWQRKTFR